MSKYIERIPLSSVERIAVVFGGGRSMAQVKGDADYILNGGFYDTSKNKPVGHLKVNGKVHAKSDWSCWGFTWGSGADIHMDVIPDKGGTNYISGVELLTPHKRACANLQYLDEVGGSRPRTAIALSDGELILYCSNTPATPEKVRDELFAMGSDFALMLDGGGSTQCDFQGKKISSTRKVNNYIAVWLKKTGNEPEEGEAKVSKKVVLDPGHGVETAGKCSPDKSYYEHEFNLDMANRIKAHLERHNVSVVLTRTTEHEPCPNDNATKMENDSLAKRVEISNAIAPDLFVSIHSNAAGNGKEWMGARGAGVYTASANDAAGRNIAAKCIVARMKEAGIALHGDGLHHNRFYVLRNTNDPAVLIEHLFHDNREDVALLKDSAYREKMAVADARGILDYLGIKWQENAVEETAGGVVCPHCGGKLVIGKG